MYFYQNITISHPPNAPWHPKVPKNNLSKKVAPKMEKFSNMAQNMSPNMRELIKKNLTKLPFMFFLNPSLELFGGEGTRNPKSPTFLFSQSCQLPPGSFTSPLKPDQELHCLTLCTFGLSFLPKPSRKKLSTTRTCMTKKVEKSTKNATHIIGCEMCCFPCIPNALSFGKGLVRKK